MMARWFSEIGQAAPSISRTFCRSRRPSARRDRARLAPRRLWASGLGVALVAVVSLAGVTTAAAQPLGAFRWQLQPYCNVVTLAVTQSGGLFTVDGSDDQCGAAQQAALVGTAFQNPDGSIGIGLTTVLAPGGAPVHIDARIEVSSLNGTWRDSAGNTGTFVFTPGPSLGGALRPVAPNGIAPGSITVAQLAPGLIGSAQIDASQVQARVTGSCPVGQYLRGIHANGTVVCDPVRMRNVNTTVGGQAAVFNGNASVAIGVDSRPIISHADGITGSIGVTHCGNAACTAGNITTTVDDPVNSVGLYSSLAIGADGLPIISYLDLTARALRVTKCGNAACTAGNVSTTVDDPANNVGSFTSIAIGADGLPIISHRDDTLGALRVTHCGNAACTAGNVSTTIDAVGNVGSYSSIAIGVDGLPIISHSQIGIGLRVTHCGNAACTGGNVSTTVDDLANSVGRYTSIAIGSNGLPIISHRDETTRALRVTLCGNVACSTSNVSATIDDPAELVGRDTSIAVGANGLPVISHLDDTAAALRVTHCGNPTCTADNISTTIDDGLGLGAGTMSSIAIGADGLPVIAHRDSGAGVVRVTKCATTTCQ